MLAEQRGWLLQNISVPGGGYLAAGPDGTFADRLPKLAAVAPDVVVLQGGTNDLGQGDVAAAATALIEQIRVALPAARIVLLSPVHLGPGEPPAELVALRDALRQVAATVRVHFVETADAFDGAAAEASPLGGITSAAHARLAAALTDDFDRLAI